MDVVAIRPELHLLRPSFGQVYLWLDADGVTLIDTGAAGSGAAIEWALAELGLARDNVRRVVLTHFHDDHAGSAAEVGGWDGVRVLAHEADAPIIRGDLPAPLPAITDEERGLHARVAAGLPPAPPARVDEELRDGDVIDFGGGARVIPTPGHTDGSIALYLPEPRVLFTGDTVARWEGQTILGPFNLDRARAAESFRRLAELEVETACVGHGEPILANASAALRATVDSFPP